MQPQRQEHPCYRCGKANHLPAKCRFMGAMCQNCGKVGHIAAVCQSGKRTNSQNQQKNTAARFPPNPRTHYVETDQISNFTDELHLFAIGSSAKPQPIKCEALIEGKPITMEVNTGAEVSLISEGTCESLFPLMQPAQSNVILKTYTGEVIPVVCELQVNVQYIYIYIYIW